jgi:hypothetical protein
VSTDIEINYEALKLKNKHLIPIIKRFPNSKDKKRPRKTNLFNERFRTYIVNFKQKMWTNIFLYTILLLGFISTQCLIDMTPITV